MPKNLLFFLVIVISFSIISNNTEVSLVQDTKSINIELSDNEYWSKTWGTAANEWASSIAVDSMDNIFIGSYTTNTENGTHDICLLKYNNSGNYEWNQTWGGEWEENVLDMVIDSSDNIFLTGYTISYGAGSFDICLLKFNNSGQLEWFKTYGGSGTDIGWGIAIDYLDNVYVSGQFDDGDESDAILIKVDNDGNFLWNYTYSHSKHASANAIAVKDEGVGAVYLAISKPPLATTDNVLSDIIVIKLDKFGLYEDNFTWGGPFLDMALDIEYYDQYVYLAGMSWNPTTLHDMCLIIIEDTLWIDHMELEQNHTIGGPGNDMAYDLAFSLPMNAGESFLYLVGGTQSAYFEDYDVYQVWYDQTGPGRFYEYKWGGTEDEFAEGVALDSSGNVFISGGTWSYGSGFRDVFLIKNLQDKTLQEIILIPGYEINHLFYFATIIVLFIVITSRHKSYSIRG